MTENELLYLANNHIMENNNKVKVFHNILMNQSFIKVYNLNGSGDIKFHEDALADNYKVLFLNANRSIRITLSLALENSTLGDSISIVIGNEGYVNENEDSYFLITEWLKYTNRNDEWKFFYLNTYEGSFEQRLNFIFEYVNNLFLDKSLSEILRGEKWIDFYFDWWGMK